ncbi:MAG TPA: hypothetical protein VLU46_07620 [Thermoanaerobaculia bacterium]|nr:hypothetical protein [Thermoanaerobaculia bacterium]
MTGTAAAAGGTLAPTLESGYTPSNGDLFTVMTFTSLTAAPTFVPPTYPGFVFQANTNATSIQVQAVAVPDLAAGTFTGPASVNAASPFTVTAPFTNIGSAAANSPSFTFTLPGGTITGGSAPGFTCTPSATTMTCSTTGSIAPGGGVSFTVNVTAPNQPGTITLTGTGNVTGDSNAANNSGSFATTVAGVSDVGVAKVGPATIIGGTNITYTITITNGGPSDATNFAVNDPPSSGLTWVSNTGACTTGFPCTIPSLLSGQTITFTSTWAVAPTVTSGTVANTVTVSATGDPNPGNDTATATSTAVSSADVKVIKSGPATAGSGSTINYSIDVTNLGPSYATGVSLDDPAQPGLTFLGFVSGPCGSFPCPLGTMSNGQTISVVASYKVTATSGSVSNVANITGTSTDPVSANNSSTATTTVTPNLQADVSITKTAPATILPGSNVNFNITVANAGPATATNVQVDDSPSSNLTFLSMSGGGCTSFPCTIASISSGTSITIVATYKVAATASTILNTATIVSASSPDPNSSNNSSTVARTVKQCPTTAPSFINPVDGATNVPVSGLLQWTNVGATSYDVYLGTAGSGCSTLAGSTSTTASSYSGLLPNTDYEARVVANSAKCPTTAPLTSPCIKFRTGSGPCNLGTPTLITPQAGSVTTSPVHFEWSSVPGAVSYHVIVKVDGTVVSDTTTGDTSMDLPLANGSVEWTVTAVSDNCVSTPGTARFTTCSPPAPPRAGVVGAPTSGQGYNVIVVEPQAATLQYEYQEATDAAFNNIVSTQKSSALTMPYVHTTDASARVFFYRVRATNACKAGPGDWSKTIRVVIVAAVVSTRPVLNVPHGTKQPVIVQVFIPGQNQPMVFNASATKAWVIKIVPSFGTLTPAGETLNVYIDPSQLPNGTFTTSIVLALTPLSGASGRITTNGTTTSYVTPVSINLVTPVVPSDPTTPIPQSLIIPAVGRLAGVNSQWRSDIRVFNSSTIPMNYLLNFVSNATPEVKQTTITTAPGDTTALDDVIHNWYGFGEVGDNASGVLEIRPVVQGGTPSALSTIVSSRTYNFSALGTLGQFIPAVPFSNFVSTGRMSLQQVAQNDNFRTNFGLVEASGLPSNVLLTMFNSAGDKLFSLPLTLNGGEQRQLNGLLSQQGVTSLSDGRMEVEVTGGDGKVTAYASVVDNNSGDPLFVPAQPIDNTTAESYVMPGVADLNTGNASWRTDMRVFNSGANPQTATLTFYPQGDPAKPVSASMTVNPGEVKVLDNVLQSLFSEQNIGGAVHVDTPGGSQLVVTGRTYNQTATGTLGQFIPAVTLADAIDKSGRALNILQVEDSVRYRTNVGVAEMTGKPVTVEISVIQPDTKITPSIQVPLAANEYLQFPLSAFGLGDVYNARVALRVVDGDGNVTAYGSVIDEATNAPTYVPAQ